MLGHSDDTWKGFSWSRVYRDAFGNPFANGVAKYQVFYYNTCVGYADSQTEADKLFLKYKADNPNK